MKKPKGYSVQGYFQSNSLFNPHRYIKLYRYIRFLDGFHKYLSKLKTYGKGDQYEYEWRLPRFGEVQDFGLKELSVWVWEREIGFPEDLEEYLLSAEKTYNVSLLAWVVQRALERVKNKKSNVFVWVIFLMLVGFVKPVSYHTFGGNRG